MKVDLLIDGKSISYWTDSNDRLKNLLHLAMKDSGYLNEFDSWDEVQLLGISYVGGEISIVVAIFADIEDQLMFGFTQAYITIDLLHMDIFAEYQGTIDKEFKYSTEEKILDVEWHKYISKNKF